MPPPNITQEESSSSSSSTSSSAITSNTDNAIITESWTRIFPEAFGIRRTIEDSPFRWCVRESFLWGVSTGTVMGLHRLRMGSRGLFAGKVAFGTTCLVVFPSYYFCYRKREHQEKVIEMMMAINDFRPTDEMPETVPLDANHPFLNVKEKRYNDKDNEENDDRGLQKEFVARLKEKKDWQEPHQTQDAENVFKEVKKKQ